MWQNNYNPYGAAVGVPYGYSPQQQVPQYQQPQIRTAPMQAIAGRQVSSLQEITPNEVPMDGSISLFPKTDGSCIYLKAWNPDGTIRTVEFIPKPVEQKVEEEKPGNDILEKLDRIEQLLIQRKQQFNNQKEGAK